MTLHHCNAWCGEDTHAELTFVDRTMSTDAALASLAVVHPYYEILSLRPVLEVDMDVLYNHAEVWHTQHGISVARPPRAQVLTACAPHLVRYRIRTEAHHAV